MKPEKTINALQFLAELKDNPASCVEKQNLLKKWYMSFRLNILQGNSSFSFDNTEIVFEKSEGSQIKKLYHLLMSNFKLQNEFIKMSH